MSRFTDYNDVASDAVATGEQLVMVDSVDLVRPDGTLLATSDPDLAVGGVDLWLPQLGTLQLDPDRTLSRTMAIQLPVGAYWVPSEPGSKLHPATGNLIRVKSGVRSTSGATVFWTLATLLVSEVEATYEQGVTSVAVTAVDPGRPLRANLVDPFSWSEDEPIESVVSRMVGLVGEATVAETGYSMPAAGSFTAGRQIFELVEQLLGSAGHEITADGNGRLFTRPIPPTTKDDTERWSYGVDGGGLPVDVATRRWSTTSPQAVIVEGGSLLSEGSTFAVTIYDTDPASAGYFQGPGEVSVETITYDHVSSPTQMVVAGYGRLRRIGAGPSQVTIQVAPNPAMRLGDQVVLWLGELAPAGSLYRVRSIDMPVAPTGLQAVTLRAAWDPQLGYGDPADPGTVCITAADDNFDRSDQNLENLQDSPGSPRWTELAYSWAVIDSSAIQRHNGTWSLAVWNTPFCSIDPIVYAQIGQVPAGKYIGPAVRSSGQFDCYAALIDSNGRITLEMWQAGSRVATLGSYSTNADPNGKSVALKAVGSALTVLYEGAAVLTASDDRRTGPFVGMHALGGTQGSTAPEISSWSAEVTT